MSGVPDETPRGFRRHHLLALVPLCALLFAPYIANRIEPRIAGMPFLLAWIVAWVVITSAVMALLLVLDDRASGSSERT